MPSKNNHATATLAMLVGVAIVGALLVVASMGEPPTISNSPASYGDAPSNASPNAEGSAMLTHPKVSPPVDDVVCTMPAEDSPIPKACKVSFVPTLRYDLIGNPDQTSTDQVAWVPAHPDLVYDNGNRPPTGAELLGR